MTAIRFFSIEEIACFDDAEKYIDYDQFFKCIRCNNLMEEPKYCPCCARIFCPSCTPSCATSSAVAARHVLNSMTLITARCKFSINGCQFKDNILKLIAHAKVCPFRAVKENFSENDQKSSKLRDFSNPLSELDTEMEDKLRKLVKEATGKKKPTFSTDNTDNTDNIQQFYRSKVEALKRSYFDYISQNFINKASIISTSLEIYFSKVGEQFRVLQESNSEAKDCSDSSKLSKLLKTSESLNARKKDMMEKIALRKAELKEKKESAFKNIETLLEKHKDTIEKNAAEYNYYNELLNLKATNDKATFKMSFVNSRKCNKCQENSNSLHKCTDCGQRYCRDKCVSVCQSESCSNVHTVLCPCKYKPCGLCRKVLFCNDCAKSCFYNECDKVYCPPCFKTNSHQLRTKNKPCNFFKCANDDQSVCILSTAYCKDCGQRLCNDCIFKDAAGHFPQYEQEE